MNRTEIKQILNEAVGHSLVYYDHENWVSFSCIFASLRHAKGADATASAGVSVNDNGQSVYNCFACHTKGVFSRILFDYQSEYGVEIDGLIEEVETGEYLGGTVPEWGADLVQEAEEPVLDKETHFGLYEPAEGHPYLQERGINTPTVRRLELLFDEDEGRIVFPIYSVDGKLRGFSGRAVLSSAALKVKDYPGLHKERNLLGVHLDLVKESSYVLLVEGLFDYARLQGFGFSAVASMMSQVTAHQASILVDLGKTVYVFYDNDTAGKKGMNSVRELLCKHVPLMQVRYPARKVWDERLQRYRPIKDPGELLRAEVEEMRRNALLL